MPPRPGRVQVPPGLGQAPERPPQGPGPRPASGPPLEPGPLSASASGAGPSSRPAAPRGAAGTGRQRRRPDRPASPVPGSPESGPWWPEIPPAPDLRQSRRPDRRCRGGTGPSSVSPFSLEVGGRARRPGLVAGPQAGAAAGPDAPEQVQVEPELWGPGQQFLRQSARSSGPNGLAARQSRSAARYACQVVLRSGSGRREALSPRRVQPKDGSRQGKHPRPEGCRWRTKARADRPPRHLW